jgi:hypothetical protein
LPKSYSDFPDGTHTVRIRATDVAGNVDATPATRSWTVDTAAPETSMQCRRSRVHGVYIAGDVHGDE